MSKLSSIFSVLLKKSNWNLSRKCDVLIISHENSYSFNLNDKYFSQILGPFAFLLSEKQIRVSTLILPYTSKPLDKYDFNACNYDREYFLSNAFDKIFGFLLFRPFSFFKKNLYRSVFSKMSPKVIICILPDPIMIRIARSLGIFTYEVMHGMGYSDLKPFYGEDSLVVASNFIVFDKITYSSVEKLFGNSILIYGIEHPWFFIFTYLPFLRKFSDNFLAKKDFLYQIGRYKKRVLYSLQWGYNRDCPDIDYQIENGVIEKCVEDAILSTEDKFIWLIRIHPIIKYSDKYKGVREYIQKMALRMRNVEFVESTELPLPKLLEHVDAHVTMSSMVSYECSWMGIRTLGLSPLLHQEYFLENSSSKIDYPSYFLDLEEDGYFTRGKLDEDFIIEWIESAGKIQKNTRNVYSEGMEKLIDTIYNQCKS